MKNMLRIAKNKFLLVLLCIGMIAIFVVLCSSKGEPLYEPGDIEDTLHCRTALEERRQALPDVAAAAATIYVVTPTYARVEQILELTRLAQTLLTVPRLTWLLVEDAHVCSTSVADLLARHGVGGRQGMPYVHLASAMPFEYRAAQYVPRGVSGRRSALKWLRANTGPDTAGVLYFLDDDNAIDIRLFEEMRRTKKVSMFPVGLIGDYMVSSPVVRDGKVSGFFDSWPAGRRFAVDMAGFALNLRVVLATDATMPYHAGYEEDQLLQNLGISLDDIEPMSDNCTQVMVWHTKTKKNQAVKLSTEAQNHENSNIAALVHHMQTAGMATT